MCDLSACVFLQLHLQHKPRFLVRLLPASVGESALILVRGDEENGQGEGWG